MTVAKEFKTSQPLRDFCHLYCNNKYYVSGSEVYLEPCQFCENIQMQQSFNCFCKKNSIVYVSEGSNYAFLAVSFSYFVNTITWSYRSRGSQMFFKIGALKNFANLTEKISVFHSLLKKVAGPQAYILIKNRFQNR